MPDQSVIGRELDEFRCRVEKDGGERLAHIALTVTRQTGGLVVKGTAVARCR